MAHQVAERLTVQGIRQTRGYKSNLLKKQRQEAAKAADAYFDKEGRPRHANTQSSVNEVANSEFSAPFSDDDAVNAVRRFPNSRAPPQNRNRNFQNKSGNASGGNASGGNAPNSSSVGSNGLCWFHTKFGEKAKKCEVACKQYDEKRFAGNAKAGRK